MADVTDLQSRMASMLDQTSDAPTAGGDDWNLRLKYLNRAQNRWQEAYDWSVLYKEVNTMTSTSSGNATIAFPSDFKKLAGFPLIKAIEYPEVDPMKRSQFSATEYYCYKLGNPAAGYNLIVNPGSLVSGSSIFYPYYASAGTLASPADKSMCPDSEYLVCEAIAQLWESREDPRFPGMKSEADMRLGQMMENEVTRGYAYDNKAQVPEESKYSFRVGRD